MLGALRLVAPRDVEGLGHHHCDKLLVVNLSVPVDVGLSDHLVLGIIAPRDVEGLGQEAGGVG